MHSEIPPHEKIRFRRGDIASLDQLPSAVRVAPVARSGKTRTRLLKRAGVLSLGLFCVLALAVGLVLTGIGDERLRIEAESALVSLTGPKFSPRIGGASVSLNGVSALALQANDLVLGVGEGDDVARVGSARFGLRLLPLVTGNVRIDSVSLGDVRLDLSAMPATGVNGLEPFVNENGLIDTDAVLSGLLAAAKNLVATLDARDVDHIELENIEIVTGQGDGANTLHLLHATLSREDDWNANLTASLAVDGRPATLEGVVTLDQEGRLIDTLTLDLKMPKPDGEAVGVGPSSRIGSAEIQVRGTDAGGSGRLNLKARVADAHLPVGREGFVADFDLDATTVEGLGKVEINSLQVASGRSRWNFHGAVGPEIEAREEGSDLDYRFELVSDGSVIAPEGSPESPFGFLARLAGNFDPRTQLLEVGEIAVRSNSGEVSGRGAVQFASGTGPGLDFRLGVSDMPVGQVKQLWPWFAAPPARNWVLANVFGGTVEDGTIFFTVQPGRLGDGVPLRQDEVGGDFSLRGARFDVAGRIPPVRDAIGTVAFRGSDVDIALKSGTAYMADDRTVDANDGQLTIRNAHLRPVIGKLNIGISGTADAVMALASYDPIDVGRFIDIKPDEISGKMKGTVEADIPLHRDIPIESLGWRVALDYEDLALARSLEGQQVAQASGSIVVDPARAVIDAKAQMNGIPATIKLVEPLGKDKSQRRRNVELQLDDKARNALAPGLGTILTGVTGLQLDDAAGSKRNIKVALDRAVLSLPWIGWSKGSGVPATAAFAMETQGNKLSLSDFRLEGESFRAVGALSLVNGSLASAKFPTARLSRGDDFSVNVTAQGRGYAITIRGKAIDARSVVKLYTADAGGSGSGDGATMPVSLDVEVAAMTGFHGETLRNVKLAFSGSRERTDRLEFSAVTASGQPVTYSDIRDGELRRTDMRSTDAGAVLRFLDLYQYMQGGEMALSLAGRGNGSMSGQVDARNFWLVNEPRLASLVSTPQGDGRTLNQAVRGNLDTQRVYFERGFSRLVKAPGTLGLEGGILRGADIGMSFQGALYDASGNMAMTGTFMPAYGLNRIFGEIPILGQILGNGRDRGLIGITFRLAGRRDNPQLEINPLSVIAPGIFRSVFEFR